MALMPRGSRGPFGGQMEGLDLIDLQAIREGVATKAQGLGSGRPQPPPKEMGERVILSFGGQDGNKSGGKVRVRQIA